jgi:hypothetical protein
LNSAIKKQEEVYGDISTAQGRRVQALQQIKAEKEVRLQALLQEKRKRCLKSKEAGSSTEFG